jgi:rod shape-determining protein MreB
MIPVPPFLEGIRELVASFNSEFQEKLRHNIVLSGGGGQMDGLNNRVEDGLAASAARR